MARLPNTDFTARTASPGAGLRGTRGVRTGGARSFGAGIGQELSGLGQQFAAIGEDILSAQEADELRQVKLDTLKTAMSFRKEMDEAVISGADFGEIQERHQEQLAAMQEGLETTAGVQALQAAIGDAELTFGAQTRKAETKRVAARAKTQIADARTLWGNEVVNNPDAMTLAQLQMRDMIGTFTNVPPELREEAMRESDAVMAQAAADGLLRENPGRLKELLSAKPFQGLSPPQTAQYLARAEQAIEREKSKVAAKTEEEKFRLNREMEARKPLGLVKDSERHLWFEKGATSAQFISMQKGAQDLHDAEQELLGNVALVRAGFGSNLTREKYDAAITRDVEDRTAGYTPEAKFETEVDTRIALASRNGKVDATVANSLNDGAFGAPDKFTLGKHYYDRLKAENPGLLGRHIDRSSEMSYEIHDFLVNQFGFEPQQAYKDMQEARGNMKEVQARLDNKELKESLIDEADDLARSEPFFGDDTLTDLPMIKKRIAETAHMYMALEPRLTQAQALKLSVEHEKRSTVEVKTQDKFFSSTFRVPAKAVPMDHDKADGYIRRTVLPAALAAKGLAPLDEDMLDRVEMIPTGDGKTAIIKHPDTGLTIFPNFPWAEGIDAWRRNVRAPEIAEQERAAERAINERVTSTPTPERKASEERPTVPSRLPGRTSLTSGQRPSGPRVPRRLPGAR